ncbi:AIG2 family protein [Chloroherpeton thalassium ATCC 35110]|uniref:Gamma-glutamylcyclotransferase family protein n=1 Tax=Chloroherpeton thalassium (strain ATCC 35110 / GB-78) TaxID=517418 RepID=B3QS02_CHLT3|nr:gamma-glutamylcyclotransferase family protein [Chloroherpeton thalassium]ACF13947.1 AIG2 family protein [Chloroherpeton thalassium ATCC 35110]
MMEKKSHLVFVYGTLMHGYHNHVLLEDAVFLGEAETVEKYRLTYTFFPMLTEPPEVHVKGELYQVDDEALANLDILEDIPHLYQRKKIPIQINQEKHLAWVYVYTTGEGLYEIPTGNYRDVRPRNFS